MESLFAYPSKDEFAAMLKGREIAHVDIVEKYLLTKEVPWAFRDKKNSYEFLLNHLGKQLGAAPESITLIGSGRIGFSLDRELV